MADRIKVEVFGRVGEPVQGASSCGCGGDCGCGGGGSCGCGGHEEVTMEELFVDFLEIISTTSLHAVVDAEFIDFDSKAFNENMEVINAMKAGYRLPITSINGQLMFHGGIDSGMIVGKLLEMTEV